MDPFDRPEPAGRFAGAASPLLYPGRIAALLVLAGLVAGALFEPNNPLRAFLRPVLSPAEPPMVADLFFAGALLVLLIARLRGALAIASQLQIGALFGGSFAGFGSLRETLLARRGGSGREERPAPPTDRDAASPARDMEDPLDEEEDPWR